MPESNFELLHNNKEKVLAFTRDVINKNQTQSNLVPKAKFIEVQDAFHKEDYGQAISLLNELKDNRLNITWTTSKNLGNGTACRIRDARNLDSSQSSLDAPEKYQMQLINQLRGAVDLINLSTQSKEEKQDSINKLKFIISKSLEDRNISSHNIRKYNTQILSVLEDAKVENPVDRLKFATEMSNFKDPHYHIVTLSKGQTENRNTYTLIEADIMLNGLTPEQQENYTKIARYKSLQNTVTGVKWFDQINDPMKKALISQQAAEIAKGHKVIPAQCLSNLEGIRNGYMKVTAISTDTNPYSAQTVLAENLHCGAPASKMKNVTQKEQDQIVASNIKQLKSYVALDKVLNIDILASTTPFDVRGENFIIDQIKSAANVDTNSLKVSISPINKWRWLGGGRDTQVFQETLKAIGESAVISSSLPNISKYLTSDRNPRIEKFLAIVSFGAYTPLETRARDELFNLQNNNDKKTRDLVQILSVAIEAKKLARSSALFSNSENINLELCSKMNQIENAINLKNRILNDIRISCPITVECCKSGKDRTGYVMLNNTVDMINAHFGLLDNSEIACANKDMIAQAGHTQEMAGIQGGTIGCHSLKTNPEFVLNKSDQHLNSVLGQKSSHFNSTIKTVDNAKQKAQIIEEFKNDYSQQAPIAARDHIPNNTSLSKIPSIKRSFSVNSQTIVQQLGKSVLTPQPNALIKKNPKKSSPQIFKRTRSNSF